MRLLKRPELGTRDSGLEKIAVLFGAVFLLTSLFLPYRANAEVVDRIAAVVNNDIITEHELSKVASLRGRETKQDVNTRQETLEKLIDETLFNQLLSKSKIEVTDDDLARQIADILGRNRMSLDQLKNELASKGVSYEEYKKEIILGIRRIKFISQVIGPQVKITDQDLRDYYQRNQERFRGSHRAHIAEIVLPLEGISSQEEFDRLSDTALSIVAKARHGAKFDSLSKQYSKGPNSAEGGDIGMVDLKDLPLEVSNAVKSLKVGETSNPILTGNAVIIVKLISLPEISADDFEKLRDDIYAALYDRKIEETLTNYLAKERQKAFVEVR